jgi:hypothetical protein
MIDVERKSFIEELRGLSSPVKRKVMFGATAISMIVIIYLWVAYFNATMTNMNSATITQTSVSTSTTDADGPGISGLFVDTASSFWQTIESGASRVVGELKSSKQYNISPR